MGAVGRNEYCTLLETCIRLGLPAAADRHSVSPWLRMDLSCAPVTSRPTATLSEGSAAASPACDTFPRRDAALARRAALVRPTTGRGAFARRPRLREPAGDCAGTGARTGGGGGGGGGTPCPGAGAALGCGAGGGGLDVSVGGELDGGSGAGDGDGASGGGDHAGTVEANASAVATPIEDDPVELEFVVNSFEATAAVDLL